MTDPSQQLPASCCSGPVARKRATTGRGITGNLPKLKKKRKRRASRRTAHLKLQATRPGQGDPLLQTRTPRPRALGTRTQCRPPALKGARRGSGRTRRRMSRRHLGTSPPWGGRTTRGARPHQRCPPASPGESGQECYAPTRPTRRLSRPGTFAPGGRCRRRRSAKPRAPTSPKGCDARRLWPSWVTSMRSRTPMAFTLWCRPARRHPEGGARCGENKAPVSSLRCARA
jgi:hypothetical protein